jgi:hypothetical protein
VTLRSSAQSIVKTGTTPSALTPAASDTLAAACFGQQGAAIRVITTGTSTDVSVSDPGYTPGGNAGTVTPVSCPATGVRMILVPRSAIAPSTQLATVAFSGALTGVTYELYSY